MLKVNLKSFYINIKFYIFRRLYETRELTPLHELRPPPIELVTPTPLTTGLLDNGVTDLGTGGNMCVTGTRTMEEDRRVAIRIKVCSECGARHVAGTCPFTRPTHRLTDACPPPSSFIDSLHPHSYPHPQNGVIVAPPHLDAPVNLSNGNTSTRSVDELSNSGDTSPLEETWRDPQRPGSPNCYARVSLPSGLFLDKRLVVTPQETTPEETEEPGMVTTPAGRQLEVVIARTTISRYTQLGPVVGVPVRERDIPDDFCMVNLWEVSTRFYLYVILFYRLYIMVINP